MNLDLAMKRYLASRSRVLSQAEVFPGEAPLPLESIYRPVRVRQRFPTRPRDASGRWEEETRTPPHLGHAVRGAREHYLNEHAWSDARNSIAFPVMVLGDPGQGKSTLLAWEFCERAKRATNPGKATRSDRKVPVYLRASDIACEPGSAAPQHASGELPTGAAGTVLTMIASRAGDQLLDEPADLRREVRRAMIESLERGDVTLLIDDFHLLLDPLVGGAGDDLLAPSRRDLFDRNLRELLARSPGVGIIVGARHCDCRAPDLGATVWRVVELMEWRDDTGVAPFIDRCFARRGGGVDACRRVLAMLNADGSVASMARNPGLLRLLCGAATPAPSPGVSPTLEALHRVVRSFFAAASERTDERAADDPESEIARLSRLALAFRRRGIDAMAIEDAAFELSAVGLDHGVDRSSLGLLRALIASGVLVPDTSDRPTRIRFLAVALLDCLAARALATETGCTEEIASHLAVDQAWTKLIPWVVGELRKSSPAIAEHVVAAILDEEAGAAGYLDLASHCAAEVPGLSAGLLDRIVSRTLTRCTSRLLGDPTQQTPGLSLSIHSGSQFETSFGVSVGPLGAALSALWRTHASAAQMEPLRRQLISLLKHSAPAVRRRAVGAVTEAALYDPAIRRTLLSRLRSDLEHDDGVRSSVVQAARYLAERDWRVRETLMGMLDAKREHDLTVRSAAAHVVGRLASRSDNTLAFAISRMDSVAEPSAIVRHELVDALQFGAHDDPRLRRALLHCLETDPDPDVRGIAACGLLIGAGDEEEIADALASRLDPMVERDDEVRAAVARSLRRPASKTERVRVALIRRIDARRERSSSVRAAAAEALIFCAGSDEPARRALAACLDPTAEKDASVRCGAVSALGAAAGENEEIRQLLMDLLSGGAEPDAMVRHLAISGLHDSVASDPRVRAILLPLMDPANEPDHSTRATVTRYLGRLAEDDSVVRAALVDLLEVHAVAATRSAVAFALASASRRDEVTRAALLRRIEPSRESDVHVRSAALHALGHASTSADDVRDALLARLNPWREPEATIRSRAVRELAPLAATDSRVRDTLVRAIDERRERDSTVRAHARSVLLPLAQHDESLRRDIRRSVSQDDLQPDDILREVLFGVACSACRDS